MMRALIAVVSLLALGSCNEVVTEAPMFSRADAAGAPPMRSGVWRELSDSPCAFDSKTPAPSWPTCASAFVIVDGAFAAYEEKDGRRALTPVADVLLAGGTPLILQFGSGGAGSAAPGDKSYGYAGVRVNRRDDLGRVVAFTFWDVECGPPPAADAKTPDGEPGRSGTVAPLPGLTMDKEGNDCSATSPRAVRDAAAASERWATSQSVAWVRDGDS